VAKRINLTGKQFGRLIVLKQGTHDSHGKIRWECQCTCPKKSIIEVHGTLLRTGRTKSCGCLALEVRTKHGAYKTREYSIWHNMNVRCNDKNNKYYGGKGISVCERWKGTNSFQNFLTDMGYPPTNEYTIDRLDSNGNYEPENCRWATMTEQDRNKTNMKINNILVADQIRLESQQGHSYASLSRKYNCDPSHIRKIVLNERWEHK